jgi:hypothetical protein
MEVAGRCQLSATYFGHRELGPSPIERFSLSSRGESPIMSRRDRARLLFPPGVDNNANE